ncbi:HipA domain-containing protein [Croceitalea rosinachiae]|uniref:HipA domain-containing protein n=1 Tax=Croceitalea rosinachiae TaxID=3075596 RepID=A0ABU3AGL9_9FLAO|nr:HipA domain-containing protein [Croceitalea sp. F388]MDT0608041.1 HipA domain-containing protein [Croceitalea sp. F388]
MKNKCLYCYEDLGAKQDFHESCSLDFFGTKEPPKLEYSLEQMSELAKNIVERSVSVPGVQPKLSMSLINEVQGVGNFRLTVVGALGGNYIFKPPSLDYPEMPQNEHVTMRIAESFGIQTVPSSLIRLQSGELSYITKRIDRTEDGQKIHMLDMFQITEAFDKYKSSMEKIGKALHTYSDNTLLDKIFFSELTLFSFLTGNNDMHLKNFSMIKSTSGWLLSPAYDLLNVAIVNPNDKEELALTLEGKKSKLKRDDFESLGKGLGLTDKQIQGVFNRFYKKKVDAMNWINASFLSVEMKEKYTALLLERYERIYNTSSALDN